MTTRPPGWPSAMVSWPRPTPRPPVRQRCYASIRKLPQPVIAQVHGLATAAGCQLVASCDLVVACQDAQFATPGVKIELFCTTPAVALARAVKAKKAMEMLLTGKAISANGDEAQITARP